MVCALLGAAAGCHSYIAKPLDPAAHQAAWRTRSPGDDSVRAYADRLAAAGDPGAVAFDPDDGLSLGEAELIALVFNADLRVKRLRAGVAAATSNEAARWDDPAFSIDVLRITESVPDRWVVTPGLAVTIPISGRLAAEQARSDAALRAALARVAEAEWAVRRNVRLAWLTWSAASMRLEEQERLIGSVSTLADATAALAERGELLRTEAALFALERSQREHELHRLRGELLDAELVLKALMGLAPVAPVSLTPSLILPIDVGERGEDDIAVRNPMLQRLKEEYEISEQTLHREIRKQYPDLTIGPLYESDQGQSRIGLLGGLPVPVFNANQRGIAEATAEREVARAAYESAYERIASDAERAGARAAALREERAYIQVEMAPLIDQQLADARRLLELGESGGLVLLESLVRSHSAKMHLIDVRRDEATALAELAYLHGPSVPADGLQPIEQTNDEVDP